MTVIKGPNDVVRSNQPLVIQFPQRDEDEVAQDDEWCEVITGDVVTKVRFHDYAQTFSIPGLYNQLFGGANSETKCISPQIMAELLREHLHHLGKHESSVTHGQNAAKLRVLDFGAGNGMVGQEVRLFVGSHEDRDLADSTLLVGFDILPEAKMAAERDRPGVYDAYIVADITNYIKGPRDEPEGNLLVDFNVLVCAGALSFGDASATAFRAAISLVQNGGLVLFNLKSNLLVHESSYPDASQDKEVVFESSDTGFSELVQQAVDDGKMEIIARKVYRHRFSVTGKPLFYMAVVAIKHAELD